MIASIFNFLNLGTGEIIIIALIVLLLFGGKKIPELMKGIGKGVSNFKKGMNDIEEEINGLMTYDREIDKFDEDVLKVVHAKLYEKFKTCV